MIQPHKSRTRCLLTIAVALLGSLAVASSASASVSHTFEKTFGTAISTPPDPYPLQNPTDVAVDNSSGPSAGDVYVADLPANQRQTVTVNATGGTFTLSFEGQTTEPIAYNAPPREFEGGYEPQLNSVETALRAILSGIGPNPFITGSTGGPYTVEFSGSLGDAEHPPITADATGLTGGAQTVQITTSRRASDAADIEKFTPAGEFLLMFGKEVDKTKVERREEQQAHSEPVTVTAAEEDLCTLSSGDTCRPGTAGTSPGAFDGVFQERRQVEGGGFVDEGKGRLFLAVDPTSGDLYVADPGVGVPEGTYAVTVSKFDENGHLITSWANGGQLPAHPEKLCPICSRELPGDIGGIAVDKEGVLFAAYGHTSRYSPAGAFIGEASGGYDGLTGIGLDAEDDVYSGQSKYTSAGVSLLSPIDVPGEGLAIDPSTNDPYVVQPEEGGFVSHFAFACTESCTPLDEFGRGELDVPLGIAIDAVTDDVFVANSGAVDVAVFAGVSPIDSTEPATDVRDTTAAISGKVDPAGRGNVTDCRFEYGLTNTYLGGGTAPCSPAPSGSGFNGPTQVTAGLTGLRPGATYHFRLVSTNANGTGYSSDRTFETSQRPSIDGFSSSHATATGADLIARIDPDGSDTHYRFEYGPTVAYGQTAPEPAGDAGSGHADQLETVHLEGLQAGVTYHFRVVAENEFGTTTTTDQTFGFSPPQCPNSTARQQTGSNSLPDCRAYELVTPSNAGTAIIFAASGTSNTGLATGPSRFAFGTFGGIVPGAAPPNSVGDLYVATRTDRGWVSHYVGFRGDEALLDGPPPWVLNENSYFNGPAKWNQPVVANPSLSEIVDWNDSGRLSGAGTGIGLGSSNAPYVWETDTNTLLGHWPTNLSKVTEGEEFEGRTAFSADLSHFVFSSNLVFETKLGKPNDVYDDNTATGAISVISRKPDNERILGASPIKVSANGDRILLGAAGMTLCGGEEWTAPACGQGELYMRVGDSATYEIAPGHKVNYLGMTADGSKVYFTSSEQLLPEDENSSLDLYMWSAARAEQGEQPLTLISKPDGAPDNNDGCHPVEGWTVKCGVKPISFTVVSQSLGGRGGNGTSDSYIASRSGDIYFYSPQQLDGNKGLPNQPNLYLYRENESRQGEVEFVATLSPRPACIKSVSPLGHEETLTNCANGPVARMDVSPDGAHMAFITNSRPTSYDNRGHMEMYSFTPATGELLCDSCIPSGAPPTSEVYGAQNGLFMTDDGRTFFSTEDALVPQDTDGTEDVYEFVDGRPQLISTGTTAVNAAATGLIGSETMPGLVAVSADGTDVYFATYDVLVPQDENGETIKIYDARTDGGFPTAPAPPPCAAAEECHGPGSETPTSPPAATSSPLGTGGNLHPLASSKLHHKKSHHRHRRRHRHHRRHGAQGRHR